MLHSSAAFFILYHLRKDDHTILAMLVNTSFRGNLKWKSLALFIEKDKDFAANS